MCSEYIINGHRFDCFGKLAKFLGGKRKVPLGGLEPLSYNTCLCPVDLQALVNKLGQRAVSDGLDVYFGDDAEKVDEDRICGPIWEPSKNK